MRAAKQRTGVLKLRRRFNKKNTINSRSVSLSRTSVDNSIKTKIDSKKLTRLPSANKDKNLAANFSFSLPEFATLNNCCSKRNSRRKSLFALGIAGKIKVKFAKWTSCSRKGC